MRRTCAYLAAGLVLLVPAECAAADEAKVDFNRDIRPILSDTCFQCHGPDANRREADLRLDDKDSILAPRDGHRLVAPGLTEQSELFRRITAGDEDRMPPPDSGRNLSPQQIDLIRRWIEQGAGWEAHWSLLKPQRPTLPKVADENGCQHPIDSFVRARLEQEGLKPSAEASKPRLICRVTLDLTGLPPTPEEVDAFLADDSPDAYERVVDRLLKSPRYGERMAMRWLDLARYADTSGYQNDGPRQMWRWRDWVIDAYNQNMPFDQFTIEQLAGDLLQEYRHFERGEPWALDLDGQTLNHLIATGFNRNHRGNAEGGIIPEEYQVEYVVDRLDTTATVWLGLTLGCARCHDHKYDPVSQREFYRVFAYFNNVPEYGRAIKEGNSPPYMLAPTSEQRRKLNELDRRREQRVRSNGPLSKRIDEALATWERRFTLNKPADWSVDRGLIVRLGLDGNLTDIADTVQQAEFLQGPPAYADGPIGRSARLDGQGYIDAGDVANFGYFDKFSITAWVYPEGDGTIVSRMTLGPREDGYYVHLQNGRLQVHLVKRWLDDSIRVETRRPLARNQWQHVAVTYDGSRVAGGINVYFDGQSQQLNVHHDFLNQTMAVDQPLRIGNGQSTFRGRIDDLRIYDRPLPQQAVDVVATAERIDEILAMPSRQRSRGQQQKLREYFIRHHAPQDLKQAHETLSQVDRERQDLIASIPTVMIMQEMTTPRATHVLERGQYDKPLGKVTPGVPSIFPPLPDGAPNNRLGLARWLVSADNPLTARVTVNRIWQMYFGEGLVRTMEDFGSQGQRPSHPDLLDWLATEFTASGWNVKQIHKTIVMSATYRQSSRVTPELIERDPENRLLARGPRFRLPAEMIRDRALAASGLLHETIGGPSVKPYQPEGLWQEIATDTVYELSPAPDLYRRSLYTYWKRTVAPPAMTTFDATAREACTVRRARTNTPLQALAIMNDVTYVEAARALAERMLVEGGKNPVDRVTRGFRLVLARSPNQSEIHFFAEALKRYWKKFQDNSDAAEDLISVGQSERNIQLDASELAAYTLVASLILNLDETLTRE